MNNTPISRPLFFAVSLCFLLSGAAGLIYQVAWGKSLGLIFGNTVYATATVLAVFMGGLALGSALLSRWAEKRDDAIALYGWIELVVAATGALSLLGLAGVRAFYVGAHHALDGSTAALVALRFIGAALVLLIPTFLMGATLPILVKGVTRTSEELGARVSRLYWVNTLGAVVGTFGSGFWLIPAFGLRKTVAVAVALNVLAGVIALALSKFERRSAALLGPDLNSIHAASHESQVTSYESQKFLLASFALVGATAIVYEVCWTRLLATTIGSSTYAFTLMLGTFLAGIVLGSALFELWAARGRTVTLRTYAATQTATALFALAFIVFFQRMPELVPGYLKGTGGSFEGLLKLQFAVSALAMVPAALAFGFNFPVVTMLIAGKPGSTGLPALADDSGLCVDALGGRPGVYTADWAERQWFEGPPGRDWYMAMGKVEGLLAEQGPEVDRAAAFVCTLAVAWPDGHSEVFEGRVEGSLTWPPRGTMGFGYDPVFVPTGSDLTFAEIEPAEKHAISHRADAFRKLVAALF